MKIEINKEDLKNLVSSELLADAIADKIIEKKTGVWNEFDEELVNAVKRSAKKVVDDIMECYNEDSEIRKRVENALRSMTKAEVIECLKDNNLF